MSLLLAVTTPPVVATITFVQSAAPDMPATPRSSFLTSVVVIAGTILAPHSGVAQPALDPGSIVLLKGATLDAGQILAPHSGVGQPAMDPGTVELLRGATLAAAGTIASAPVLTEPPSAPTGAMLIGATLEAGSVLAPHSGVGQPSMDPGAPALLAGATLAAAGTILAPHSGVGQPAMDPGSATTLVGATPPASGTIASAPVLTEPPSAPTGAMLIGATLEAGSVLAPHSSIGQPSMDPGAPGFLPGATLEAGSVLAPHSSIGQPAMDPGSAITLVGAPAPAAPVVILAPTTQPELPETPLARFLSGAGEPAPPPSPAPAGPIPRVGRFAGSGYVGGGGGPIAWITFPDRPPTLLQGNWLRDPILVQPDGTEVLPAPPLETPAPTDWGAWWQGLLRRSGQLALVRTERAQATHVQADAGFGEVLLSIAKQIAGAAREEKARRIALEQVVASLFLQASARDAAAEEERARWQAEVQSLTGQVEAQQAELGFLRERVTLAETPELVPAEDPVGTFEFAAWNLGDDLPAPAPPARRRVWPYVFVGVAFLTVALLFATGTSKKPQDRKRQRPRRRRKMKR